jgi:hypothetical protein
MRTATNPAKSSAQYRMAQAGVEREEYGVARELVDKTSARMRSEFMRQRNPDTDTNTDVTTLLTEAFEKGVEVGQSLGSSTDDVVDVVESEENPRQRMLAFKYYSESDWRDGKRLLYGSGIDFTEYNATEGSWIFTYDAKAKRLLRKQPVAIPAWVAKRRINPRKRNSIFLTPAVMAQLGQSGVGRMLTSKLNPSHGNYATGPFLNRPRDYFDTMSDAKLDADRHSREYLIPYVAWSIKSQMPTDRGGNQNVYNSYPKLIKKKGKRNPDEASAELYEEFHGKPSEQLTEYVYEEHEHDSLAQLGELISVTVLTTTGYEAKIDAPSIDGPVNDVVQLCSSEDRRQLYFVGGNQAIDVEALGFSDSDIKDLMVIGVLAQVEYCTKKKFHKFKPVDYYHELGEETGVQPILLYDPISQLMKVAGGAYEVKDVGIVN